MSNEITESDVIGGEIILLEHKLRNAAESLAGVSEALVKVRSELGRIAERLHQLHEREKNYRLATKR